MALLSVEEGSCDAKAHRPDQRFKPWLTCQMLGLAVGKAENCALEMKEDQNEESLRNALQKQTQTNQPKAKKIKKGNVAQAEEQESTSTAAAAKPKSQPKAKPKSSPSDPKDQPKKKGQGASAKPDCKGKGTKGDGKAKTEAKPKSDKPSVPCIFWPKGACTRGESCPFYHDPKFDSKQTAATAKSAPNPKGRAAEGSASSSTAAKATVATVVVSSLPKVIATDVVSGAQWATSICQRFQQVSCTLVRPFRSLFKCLTALLCLTNPAQQSVQQISTGTLAFAPSSASQCLPSLAFAPSGASQCLPALLSSSERAMIAQNHSTEGTFELSWIAYSGAGRDLASLKALQDQGIPTQIANQFMQTTGNVRFETGNGHVNSDTSITANGNLFGHASFCMMNSCPVVRSLGQIVATGKPFVWLPDQMPFFGCDEGAIQLSADMERVIFADKVDDHVPIFTEVMQFDSTSTFGFLLVVRATLRPLIPNLCLHLLQQVPLQKMLVSHSQRMETKIRKTDMLG